MFLDTIKIPGGYEVLRVGVWIRAFQIAKCPKEYGVQDDEALVALQTEHSVSNLIFAF